MLRAYVKKYKAIDNLIKKTNLSHAELQELEREVNSEGCRRAKCCVPPPHIQSRISELLQG